MNDNQFELVKSGIISPAPKNNANDEDKKIRKILKENGFLSRDARIKERRKYGLKKARKASQYSKR